MTRPRHAMRVHPLRTKGVVVGVPVAAAVAFGAHSFLGVTPVSDQQQTQPSTSAAGASQPGTPVQSYGLAPTPPPTTLGLLSAPSAVHGSAGHDAAGPGSGTPAGTGSVAGGAGSSDAGAQTVPIKATAPPPSMITFAPAKTPAAAAASDAHAQQAAPQVAPQSAPQAAPRVAQSAAAPAPTTAPAETDGGSTDGGSSGGSLLGVDLGVAKVLLLSFGG